MAIDKLFLKGLKEDYLALETKNPNTVYLLTDTGEAVVDEVVYGGGLRIYTDTLPANPAQDVIYYNESTGIGSYYNGTAWKVIVKPTVNAITAGASNDEIPTAKAVKDYVDAGIEGVTSGSAIVTEIESKAGSNGTLTVTMGDDSTIDVPLTGVAHDITYNSSTLVVTIPMVGAEPLVINLPQDNFVESGEYNEDDETIDLTLKDGSVVSIPAAALVDVYTSGSGVDDTVAISITSDNKISASFKVDTTGVLSIAADGKLTIDLTDYATVSYVDGLIGTINARVEDLEDSVDILNGDATTAGSVAKALADAKAYADGLNSAMITRVADIENALVMGTF